MACKILLHLFIAALLIHEGKSWEFPDIGGVLNSLLGKSKEAAKSAKAAAAESVHSAADAARQAARDTIASAKAQVSEAKAHAKEVVGLTIDFAKKSARAPSPEVLAMLEEEGFKQRHADSSCARAGVAVRCVVFNAAITIDTHDDSETGAIKVRLSVYTPGLPPVTKDLTSGETKIALPGLAMQTPLADLGMFLRVQAAHGAEGELDINIAVTACADLKTKLLGLKPCLPNFDILTIANGKIVMASNIAAVSKAFTNTPQLAAGFLKSIQNLNPIRANGDSAEDKIEL